MPRRPPRHQPAGSRRLPSRSHGISPAKRGYGRTWRKLRLMFLREHPLCARCGQPAEHVDHVRPKPYSQPDYDPDNLQALCASCHSKKTAEERGKNHV